MFKALRAMFKPNLWKKAGFDQRLSSFAVEFGVIVMLDAVLFLMIVVTAELPMLIGAGLSLLFLIVLLSMVLDWFWDWTKDEVMEG